MPNYRTGLITHANLKRAMYVVQCDDSGYVVLELLGSPEPDRGDRLSAIPAAGGRHTVFNETQNRRLDVYVQAHDATLTNALSLIANR